MKRSINFRGRAGKHLTLVNFAALCERYGVDPAKALQKPDDATPYLEAMEKPKGESLEAFTDRMMKE